MPTLMCEGRSVVRGSRRKYGQTPLQHSSQSMESTSTASTPTLGPAVSLNAGASTFLVGDLVLVRIPFAFDELLDHALSTSTAAGSGIPPTSSARNPQHFAFVRSIIPCVDGVELEVYPM